MFIINHKLLERNLIPALLQCNSIRDRKVREDIVKRLPTELRDNIHRRDANLSDVSNIVLACADYSNGLQNLIDAVAYYEQHSIPMEKALYAWTYVEKISGISDMRLRELLEITADANTDNLPLKVVFDGLRREFSVIRPIRMEPLWQVAVKLWDIPLQLSSIQPIQVFVEHLAFHLETCCHQSKLALTLRTWNEKYIADFNVTVENLLSRRERIKAGQDYAMTDDLISLMVVLNPDPNNTMQSRRFKFRVYWWNASQPGSFGVKPLYIEEHFVGWENIGQELARLAEEESLCSGEALVNLRFEFFLPIQCLSESVDQMEYEDAYASRLKLGANYQVVVRSLERAQRPKSQPGWYVRWEKYRDCDMSSVEPTISRTWESIPSDPQQLLNDLQIAGELACVGLGCTPPGPDHIKKILSAGVPIAIWMRSHEGAECLPEHTIQKVQVLTKKENIRQLPRLVHQERQQANTPTHPGNHLTLLWDDPTRIPADLSTSPYTRLQAP